uniref:RING-type domain-containing protein n=1 Tax=Leersia perrieri TaxID=77586 RepID=A0A0D9VTZ4_9ORYZ
MEIEDNDAARHGFGKMGFGCKHYRRRCRIRAPCCNDVFHCRHCHNESTVRAFVAFSSSLRKMATSSIATQSNRSSVSFVTPSSRCVTTAAFAWESTSAGSANSWTTILTGSISIAKIVASAGSCYSVSLRDKHYCIENSMKNNCPICYEYLFDSLRETSVLRCGHTMHLQCFHEMLKHDKFSCPICSMPIFDMDKFLRALDAEIEAGMLHIDYMGKGWIVCNDCRDTTQVYSRVAGHKCCHCQSHNTCRVAAPVLPA